MEQWTIPTPARSQNAPGGDPAIAIDGGITLKKLEAFQSFMTLGNVGRVSETLGQSMVSVRRALHSLEEGLRCPLFKCDGHRLTPLSTVHMFAEHVKRILAEHEAGVRRTREAVGFPSITPEIGELYSMTVSTLPRIFVGLKTRRSALDVELTLGSSRSLLAKLEDGQLGAIAITLGKPLRNPDLLTVPIFDDEILFATPPGSPRALSAKIDLRTVCSKKFVAPDDGFVVYHDPMAALDKAGSVPQIALRVSDVFLFMNLVNGDVGYVLLPRRMADFSPRVQLIPLAARYTTSQHVVFAIQRNRGRDPNLLALSTEYRLLGAR